MAHFFIHALSSVPFALTGNWSGVIGCLLPDVSWLPNELVIRKNRHLEPLKVIEGMEDQELVSYRVSHSLLCWLFPLILGLLCSETFFVWLFFGAVVHILLDLPTHNGRLCQMPLFPLQRLWRQGRKRRANGKCVVLFSGGWDSTYCAVVAKKRFGHDHVECCFFDYGQPYRKEEIEATKNVARQLDLSLKVFHIRNLSMDSDGMFEKRNETLFVTAFAHLAPDVVFIGSRCPLPCFDKFGDSNWVWARNMVRKYGVEVRTPCVTKPKWLIKWLVIRAGIGSQTIFSTEGWKPSA